MISPLNYYIKRLKVMLPDQPEITVHDPLAMSGSVSDISTDTTSLNTPTITVRPIDIDETKPEIALEAVMKKIQELYKETDPDDQEAWMLWFDTHGGFRDISMVMVSAARLFVTDKHEPIPTDGIFSIYHSQNNDPDRIVDQTGFYFTDSAQSLREFLNFGQYLAMSFSPYEGKKPYGFISYRHDKHFLTHIRNVFTWFKKSDILYWFDEGINYGDIWREKLKDKNEQASVFIMLLTNSYFDSPECWKELIQAIYHAKKAHKKNHIYILLLEENIHLPESIPTDEKFAEALELAKELKVSDCDIYQCLGHQDNIQWLQWYQYMDEAGGINNRNINMDDRLDSVADLLKSALNEA